MKSSEDEEYIPQIPKDLLEFLQRRVPSKDFSPSDTLREIDFYGGKREIVNFLQRLYDDQLSKDFL